MLKTTYLIKAFQLFILFQCVFLFGQAEAVVTLGSSTSSSATRGPFQRSDIGSSSVYSRAQLLYSASELSDLTSESTITKIRFDLGSTNIIKATGDATMLIYMKNSSLTDVPTDPDWADVINGATLVGTYTFNTTNNFPGVEGFFEFDLDADFDFDGDALEVAIDWDCSGLTAQGGDDPNQLFDGNGSLNWHWTATSHQSLVYSASSSQPSTITSEKAERVNTQIVYNDPNADYLLQLGSSTSSSATRGPFQRSDIGSSSVYSRAQIVYTAAELADLTTSATIKQINFDLGSTNIIKATGDATMLIYMKNSSLADVPADDDWTDVINGATLVGSYTFNTTTNFPGAEGFLSFDLDSEFDYTGGTLEVAVDWDCSGLTAQGGDDPNQLFDGNGSLNWHWSATSHQSLLYSASSSQPSTITSDKAERVNTQFIFNINEAASVEKNSFSSKVQIAPNPSSRYISIQTNEIVDAIEVYDMLGKRINILADNNRLDISSLVSGVYLIKIKSGEATAVKRIIKN